MIVCVSRRVSDHQIREARQALAAEEESLACLQS